MTSFTTESFSLLFFLANSGYCYLNFNGYSKFKQIKKDEDDSVKPATHLAILYAHRGEFDRHRLMRTRSAIFFRRSRLGGSFEKSCDKIAQPDGLALLAIYSNDRRKSREREYLANAGEFNRRYLPCQISAILYSDRGNWRKSRSLHQAHLAILAYKIAKFVAGFSYSKITSS